MSRALAIVLALGWTGCSQLPDAPLNQCGNHILETDVGEECDATRPGCGAPGTPGACRFVCDPAKHVACPTAYVCGRDRICRQPLQTYTLGPAIGAADERMQIVDLDGDGNPDLAGRTLSGLQLRRNDGSGGMSLLASGTIESNPIPQTAYDPSLAVASPSTNPPLVAVNALWNGGGVDLYTWQAGAISPLIVPTTVLPMPTTSRKLVGTLSYGDPLVLLLDATRLAAFALGDPRQPESESSGVDLVNHCNLGRTNVDVHAHTSAMGINTISLVGDRVCVGGLDAQGKLFLEDLNADAFLQQNGATLGSSPVSALLDIDGNGLDDLMVLVTQPAPSYAARVIWLQTATGFLPPVLISGGDLSPSGWADFNGDGRDDYISNGALYLNLTQGKEASFSASSGFEVGYSQILNTSSLIGGDLNGDHHADFVSWQRMFGMGAIGRAAELTYCFGDGSGMRFTCGPALTPLFDDVLMGDINGDSIGDLILPGSGLGLMLGHYLAPPSVVPSSPQAFPGTTLDGVTLAPQRGKIAQQVLAAVEGQDGAQGIASGHADATGALQFGYPLATWDVTLADYTGDGHPDLALLRSDPNDAYVTIFDGALPYHVVDLPLGLKHNFNLNPRLMFCPIQAGAVPLVCGKTWDGTFWARWNGTTFDVHVVPVPATPDLSTAVLGDLVQTVVDLDGDGVPEALQQIWGQGSASTLRVLHTAANGNVDVIDSPGMLCEEFWLVLDVPPFDGRLDLSCSGLYVQQPDFTFKVGTIDNLPKIFDESHKPIPENMYPIWRGTADFNGDGITDLLVHGNDGLMHIAFADVARR